MRKASAQPTAACCANCSPRAPCSPPPASCSASHCRRCRSGTSRRLIPATFPGGSGPGLDWRVLAFTVALTVLTVLLFGAGPAFAAARRGFNETLKKGVGGNAEPRSGRMRNALVVAEITFTVVLLAAAGLLLRSYAAVLAVDPGFRADNLLVAETALAPSKYGELADRTEFYRRVVERVNALPGVESAGYVNFAPLLLKGGRAYVSIEGQPPPPQRGVLAQHRRGPRRGHGLLRDARRTAGAGPAVRRPRRTGRRSHGDHQPSDGPAFLARPGSHRCAHQDRHRRRARTHGSRWWASSATCGKWVSRSRPIPNSLCRRIRRC